MSKEHDHSEFLNYLKSIEEEIIKLETTKINLKQAIKSLEYLKNNPKGEKILNLGSFYIQMNEDLEEIIVPIGDKYLMKLKIGDGLVFLAEELERIEKQIESLKHYYEHLVKEFEEHLKKEHE